MLKIYKANKKTFFKKHSTSKKNTYVRVLTAYYFSINTIKTTKRNYEK